MKQKVKEEKNPQYSWEQKLISIHSKKSLKLGEHFLNLIKIICQKSRDYIIFNVKDTMLSP